MGGREEQGELPEARTLDMARQGDKEQDSYDKLVVLPPGDQGHESQ